MKLGEIKIEAFKLMYAEYLDDLQIEHLENMKNDENFGRILCAMPGAINRCFMRIEESGVLPLKTYCLNDCYSCDRFNRLRFNLDDITDFYKINRIIFENEYEYDGNCNYIMETNSNIVLPKKEGLYTLVYHPTIRRITDNSLDTSEINIPDNIACIIPYFIKGDLFKEDEPSMATEARNLFEALLSSLKSESKTRQTHIKTIYNQVEE